MPRILASFRSLTLASLLAGSFALATPAGAAPPVPAAPGQSAGSAPAASNRLPAPPPAPGAQPAPSAPAPGGNTRLPSVQAAPGSQPPASAPATGGASRSQPSAAAFPYGMGRTSASAGLSSPARVARYRDLILRASQAAGADPAIVAGLMEVEGSGEGAVSPAGALGLMQLMPDKFEPGDDPFHVPTNLARAARHIALLEGRYGSGERVAAAYFGAIDGAGNVTGASDGNVDGFEYVRQYQASLACVRMGAGLPGGAVADLISPSGAMTDLLSPIGVPITPAHISFGFLDDYGLALASYIRGAHGVQHYGTRHLAWDLIIPGAPGNGRGYPVFAPLAGRIVRTSDPVGGPFGIWLENAALNLRVRLMHMDSLAPDLADGSQVRAGQWLGVLGAQGTPEFPHLHLSLELLATGERLDPARFYFRAGARVPPVVANGQPSRGPTIGAVARAPEDRFVRLSIPSRGLVGDPKSWGGTVVWEADGPEGHTVMAYDLDLGWAFRVGGPAAAGQTSPAISGQTVVWLDTRHAIAAGGDAATAMGLADVYSYDLRTGEERRLTPASSHYSDLAISGQSAAWVRRGGATSIVEVYDFLTDTVAAVDRSAGRLDELTISGPLLVWTDYPVGSPREAGGNIRGYQLERGHLVLAQQGRASHPAVVGSTVFWEELVGRGPERLIRGRDLLTDRERTLTSEPAQRRGLRAADGVLMWEELTAGGRAELRMYGLSSDELLTLSDRPSAAAHGAAIGRGTVVWRTDTDELAVAHLLEWDLASGRFYAEGAGERSWAGRLGYGVTNEGGIPLWDEFRRLGGATVLGRPLSGRVTFGDGLVYLLTERALLQWRPDLSQVVLANPLELLEHLGHDGWLHDQRQVPRPIVDDGAGDDWVRARATRLGWMSDPVIRRRFFANPDPERLPHWGPEHAIALYGLPMSEPEDFGPFVAQRFQRAVLQRWKGDEPGQPPRDSVTLVRVGAIFRALVLDAQTRSDDSD